MNSEFIQQCSGHQLIQEYCSVVSEGPADVRDRLTGRSKKERQGDTLREKETERLSERQIDREIQRGRDRHIEIHTDRHRERQREDRPTDKAGFVGDK